MRFRGHYTPDGGFWQAVARIGGSWGGFSFFGYQLA
jgi:multisubunit Na+/H+ antiporter MnhB subunit